MTRIALHIIFLSCLALAACGQGTSELMAEGDQYMKDGNHMGAIVIYKTVLENAPENMEARLGIAKAYLGAGKPDKAQKNFEKYLRQNPYDKSVLLDMAKLSAYDEDNAGAVKHLKAYIEEYPESSEAYELLGKNYWVMGDKQNAKASFAKAVEVGPNDSGAKFSMAQYYAAEGDKAKARTYIDAILASDPADKNALHYRASEELAAGDVAAYQMTLGAILENHPADAYAKYALAKSYVTQNNFDKALEISSQLKMEAPGTGYGQKVDGLIRYTQKDYRGSVDAYLESISIRPDIESYLYLGLSQYGAGDLETAISNLRIAADRAPEMVRAREMISLILFQQKRYNESIAEAEKVLQVDSENVIARVIKGDAYSAQGDANRALAQLKEITEKDPSYAAAFMKMGALHYSKGDISKSEAAFKGAMKAAPDSLRPRLVLSDFYLRNGNKSQARKVLEEGLKGTKDDVALYTYLARMELADRKPEEAKALLNKAKVADKVNPASYMMLASISLAAKNPELALEEYDALLTQRPGYLRALLAKAVILDTLQRHDEAEVVYKEGVKSGHPRAYMAYAGSKRKAGDNEAALVVLNEGIAKSPDNAELLKVKAETLYGLKRFEDVLAMCDEIEVVSRDAAYSLRVRTYMLMNDVEKAVSTGRQLCDINPKDPRGYLTLANVYMRTKQIEEWRKILDEGVAKSGPNASLLMELSKYYAYSEDYNKALTYLDSVIKRNDKYPPAYSMRGDIYTRVGRDEKAIKSYQKALELNDKYVPALNNLAMMYLNNPKMAPEALRLAYKAYLQVPWNPSVMDTFGYALAVNGKKDAAVSVLEKAVAVEADNPTINYHLGYAYFKAGKNEQAVAVLKPVADCADCPDAEGARELLKKIQ